MKTKTPQPQFTKRALAAATMVMVSACGASTVGEVSGAEPEQAFDTTARAVTGVANIYVSSADDGPAKLVNYRRGFVQQLNKSVDVDRIDEEVGVGANLINTFVDLNLEANRALFIYDAGALYPSDSQQLSAQSAVIRVRPGASTSQMPAFVQLNGLPRVVNDDAGVNWADTNYTVRLNRNGVLVQSGNLYPLPKVGLEMETTQTAIANFILKQHLSTEFEGAVWIGQQEPSHTTLYSSACAVAGLTEAQGLQCRMENVDRYIAYWSVVAKAVRRKVPAIRLGGIQLNSNDHDLYVHAARQMVCTGMPIDVFTIQRYEAVDGLMNDVASAYAVFHPTPSNLHSICPDKSDAEIARDYAGVKVAFNRYSFGLAESTSAESINYYTKSTGMIRLLNDEREMIEKSEIMYGYARETGGLASGTTGSLLNQVMVWLQAAPGMKKAMGSAPDGTGELPLGLQGFALVKKANRKASIALWNPEGSGNTANAINLTLPPGVFTGRKLTISKGADAGITERVTNNAVDASGKITLTGTLAPGEFMLLTAQSEVP